MAYSANKPVLAQASQKCKPPLISASSSLIIFNNRPDLIALSKARSAEAMGISEATINAKFSAKYSFSLPMPKVLKTPKRREGGEGILEIWLSIKLYSRRGDSHKFF